MRLVVGKKIFVSYKYGDWHVAALPNNTVTTARHYVDELTAILKDAEHIFKGEDDDESLEDFQDTTIASKLRDKIYDSSITIVMISRQMKDEKLADSDQWIPWEVAYSLRESTRSDRTSRTNAVLAIVLPDLFGSYEYFIEENTCPNCKVRSLNLSSLFNILRLNMLNIKNPVYSNCSSHDSGTVYTGDSSYIHSVKWSDFVSNCDTHLERAITINDNINDYNLTKTP